MFTYEATKVFFAEFKTFKNAIKVWICYFFTNRLRICIVTRFIILQFHLRIMAYFDVWKMYVIGFSFHILFLLVTRFLKESRTYRKLFAYDCRFLFFGSKLAYAYLHYPFENAELFENNFPGHFVSKGLDQTSGWLVLFAIFFNYL